MKNSLFLNIIFYHVSGFANDILFTKNYVQGNNILQIRPYIQYLKVVLKTLNILLNLIKW